MYSVLSKYVSCAVLPSIILVAFVLGGSHLEYTNSLSFFMHTQRSCAHTHTHDSLKRNEDPALRLTVLQALHGAVRVVGGRMSEKHKSEILTTLLTLYSTAQVSCVCMCRCLCMHVCVCVCVHVCVCACVSLCVCE